MKKIVRPFVVIWMLLCILYWTIRYPDLIDEILNENLEY